METNSLRKAAIELLNARQECLTESALGARLNMWTAEHKTALERALAAPPPQITLVEELVDMVRRLSAQFDDTDAPIGIEARALLAKCAGWNPAPAGFVNADDRDGQVQP